MERSERRFCFCDLGWPAAGDFPPGGRLRGPGCQLSSVDHRGSRTVRPSAHSHVRTWVCVHVCLYVCMYVHTRSAATDTNTHIHTYTHTYQPRQMLTSPGRVAFGLCAYLCTYRCHPCGQRGPGMRTRSISGQVMRRKFSFFDQRCYLPSQLQPAGGGRPRGASAVPDCVYHVQVAPWVPSTAPVLYVITADADLVRSS